MLKDENLLLESGKLPAYAWPGGYPIYYLTEDNAVLCPDCANGENGSDAYHDIFLPRRPVKLRDPQWHLVAYDVYYEGPPMQCEHCNGEIESAYGDPDAPECDECGAEIPDEDGGGLANRFHKPSCSLYDPNH